MRKSFYSGPSNKSLLTHKSLERLTNDQIKVPFILAAGQKAEKKVQKEKNRKGNRKVITRTFP